MWRYPSRGLKDELQLLVAAHVAAPRDRAARSRRAIAPRSVSPPRLGHKAIKAIPASYKGPLMSLSNRVLMSGGAVGEADVRRYVRESDAVPPHLGLADALNEVAQLNSLVAPSVACTSWWMGAISSGDSRAARCCAAGSRTRVCATLVPVSLSRRCTTTKVWWATSGW